jgi:DNA repair REX1-B
MASSSLSSTNPTRLIDALKQLLSIEEERAVLYVKWRAAFRLFLEDKTMEAALYRSVLVDITAGFGQMSQRVNDIEASLRLANAGAIADQVRNLQLLEKSKLESTVRYQQRLQAHEEQKRECNHHHHHDEATVDDPDIADALSVGRAHSHSDVDDDEVDFVFEREKKQLKQEANRLTLELNDAIDALRIELYDLL